MTRLARYEKKKRISNEKNGSSLWEKYDFFMYAGIAGFDSMILMHCKRELEMETAPGAIVLPEPGLHPG
jgi:hypothetical protein